MLSTLRSVSVDCIVVFGGALVLALLLRFGRTLLDAIPMSRARLALVTRLRPLAAAILIATYSVIAARWILASAEEHEWTAIAAIAAIVGAASWNVLRNALEGVYLRVGRSFELGDRVEIAGVAGRVHRLGARAVVLETTDGQLAIIPYTTVAAATIRREPFDEQSAFHVFRVAIPEHRPVAELKRAVHEAALLCHWSSTRRLPQVTATDDGHLEITVFPVDANHAPEIERVVRGALG
ncbi:MAG: mechanosensitive ion channel domain-containing protein [Kofleriaceae bacterium]